MYATVGVGVAWMLRHRAPDEPTWTVAAHAALWPFFAPLLLSPDGPPKATEAEERLLAALARLDGPAGQVLAPEVARLRAAIAVLAGARLRLAEMDATLRMPEFDRARAEARFAELSERGCAPGDPRVGCVRAQINEIERLCGLRDRARADLERAELTMEALSARVSLLRFAERPGDDAVELIRDLATTVEAVGETLELAA